MTKRVLILSGETHPLLLDLTNAFKTSNFDVINGVFASEPSKSKDNSNYNYLPVDCQSISVEGPIHAIVTLPLINSPAMIANQGSGYDYDLIALQGARIVGHAAKLAEVKSARLIVVSSTMIYGDAMHEDAKKAWTNDSDNADLIPEAFRGYVSTFHTQAPFVETCRTTEAWCSVAYREMGVDSVLARVGCIVNDHMEADGDGSFITSSISTETANLPEKVSISTSSDISKALVFLSTTPASHLERAITDKDTPEHVFETSRVFNIASPQSVCKTVEIVEESKKKESKNTREWVTRDAGLERGGGYVDSAFILPDTRRFCALFPEWGQDTLGGVAAFKTLGFSDSDSVSVSADVSAPCTPTPHVLKLRTLRPNPDKRLVVLLGGAGFLGSNLVRRLLGDGYQVIVLDNLAAGLGENVDGFATDPRYECDFEFFKWDAKDPFTFDFSAATPHTPYAVVHAASLASPEFYYKDMQGTLHSGIDGTWSVFTFLKSTDYATRYSLTSTSECYGDPFCHPQHTLYLGNVNTTGKRCQYDQSKRYAEVLSFAHLRRGANVRVSRIFNTYGDYMRPDDGRVVTNFLDQALCGTPLTVYGQGLQTRSFTYMDDQIDGQMRLLETEFEKEKDQPTHSHPTPHPLDRVFNIGNDTVEMTMMELAEAAAKLVKRMVGRDVRIIKTHWAEIVERGIVKREDAAKIADELNAAIKEEKEKKEKKEKEKEGESVVGYIVVDDDSSIDSGLFMVVKDEYDPYDPKQRRADAGPARRVLGWGGSKVPLERGMERLLQFLLVRRMELKGIDGHVRVFDYCKQLMSEGYGVTWKYLEEKLHQRDADEREAYFIMQAYKLYHEAQNPKPDVIEQWKQSLSSNIKQAIRE